MEAVQTWAAAPQSCHFCYYSPCSYILFLDVQTRAAFLTVVILFAKLALCVFSVSLYCLVFLWGSATVFHTPCIEFKSNLLIDQNNCRDAVTEHKSALK